VQLATKQAAAADQLEVLSPAPDDAFPFGLRVTIHLLQLPRAEREHLYAHVACGCRSVSRKYSAGISPCVHIKRPRSNRRCDVSALAEHGRLCTAVHNCAHRRRPLIGMWVKLP